MKYWCLTFCLVVASLFGSVGVGFACQLNQSTAHTCARDIICTQAIRHGDWEQRSRYQWAVQEAKRRGLTCGIKKSVFLKSAFIKLSEGERKQIQKNLARMGYYKSSIDGLYGKGTAGALLDYNTDKLHNSNLKKSKNVNLLFSILSLKIENIRQFSSNFPPCPDNQKVESWDNCLSFLGEGAVKLTVEYKNGAPNGLGFLELEDKAFFGEFLDGDLTQGIMTYADGSKYTGEFYRGEYHGEGTLKSAEGGKYTGTFKKDKPHGFGSFVFPDGGSYIGWLKAGLKHGVGTRIYFQGAKYVGEWEDNKRHGEGNYFFPDGGKYEGQWQDDHMNGQGYFTHPSGAVYKGDFKNGDWHGRGIIIFTNGDKYVGHIKNNKRNGEGVFTSYSNGENTLVKEGIWKNGEFQYAKKISISSFPDCLMSSEEVWTDCFGAAGTENDDTYVGLWKNNKFHGSGTFTFANGNYYVGEFRDNNFNGQGTLSILDGGDFADREEYVGTFKDDEFNGQGTYTVYSNGNIKSAKRGTWKDGKLIENGDAEPPITSQDKTDDNEMISASSGSGFAVSEDGYVVTNHHVIEGCQKVLVHSKEQSIQAIIVTSDPQNDLALLKADFKPDTVFPLSADRPELLQDIYVAGYPFGKNISSSVKVTKGIISSLTGALLWGDANALPAVT